MNGGLQSSSKVRKHTDLKRERWDRSSTQHLLYLVLLSLQFRWYAYVFVMLSSFASDSDLLHFLYIVVTDSYTLWPGREDPPRIARWAYPMVKLHTELLGSDLSDVVAMHDFAVSTRISFRLVLRFSFYWGFWVYTFRLFRNWSLFPVSFSVSVFGDVFQRRFFSEKTFELRTQADETKDVEDSFQVDESMFFFRLEWFGMRVMIYVFSRMLSWSNNSSNKAKNNVAYVLAIWTCSTLIVLGPNKSITI